MPSARENSDLKDRLVSAAPVEDDSTFELKLRPQRLQEFIGQNKVKENLDVAIQAAKSRGEALDHVLLYGPPGLGKTTLANIIANELGTAFQQTSGPTLQIKGDLTAIPALDPALVEKAKAEARETGRADFEVPVEIRNPEGEVVAEVVVEWAVRRMG